MKEPDTTRAMIIFFKTCSEARVLCVCFSDTLAGSLEWLMIVPDALSTQGF